MKTGNFIPENVKQSLSQQTKIVCLCVKSCEFYNDKKKTFVTYSVDPVICLRVIFLRAKISNPKSPSQKLHIFSFHENFGVENVNFLSKPGRLNIEQTEKHNLIHMKDVRSF